jgi:cell division protein FtsL
MEISSKIKKNLKKPTIQTIFTEKESIEKPNPENSKWVPKAFLGFRIIIWLHLSWGFLYVVGEATVLNAITDFKQHIRIVAPYIESKEKDLLISDWSQMRKLDDYNDIYKKLIEIAKENDLKLYKNKQH